MGAEVRARPIPAPAVAPAVDRLAAAVPERCPNDGCRALRTQVVRGGDDRRPIVEVVFACGRLVHAETAQ